MFGQFGLTLLEKALNTYLKLDPESATRINRINKKVLLIRMPSVNWQCYFIPSTEGFTLLERYEGEIAAEIITSPLGLLTMVQASKQGGLPIDENIKVVGDLDLAQDIKDILCEVDIDWEEYLSRVAGDTVAHNIHRQMSDIMSWGKGAAESFTKNVTEYLQEEKRQVPPRAEVNDFCDDVDDLRDDLARIEARLQRFMTGNDE